MSREAVRAVLGSHFGPRFRNADGISWAIRCSMPERLCGKQKQLLMLLGAASTQSGFAYVPWDVLHSEGRWSLKWLREVGVPDLLRWGLLSSVLVSTDGVAVRLNLTHPQDEC